MTNPFLEAIYHKFTYECNGETITLTNEETKHASGKYFVVVCDKCCNIPVLHSLREDNGECP